MPHIHYSTVNICITTIPTIYPTIPLALHSSINIDKQVIYAMQETP